MKKEFEFVEDPERPERLLYRREYQEIQEWVERWHRDQLLRAAAIMTIVGSILYLIFR